MIIIRPLQENGIYFSYFKTELQIDSENSELHPKGSDTYLLILYAGFWLARTEWVQLLSQ